MGNHKLDKLEKLLADATRRLRDARQKNADPDEIKDIRGDIESIKADIEELEGTAVTENFSFIRELLSEDSKGKKKKRSTAASIYHRDYMKTRHKPYRKYDGETESK